MKQFWTGIIGAAVFGALVLIGVREVRNRHLSETSDKATVKIGVLYPMSGDGAVYGKAAKAAVEMFFDEFNKQPRKFNYQVIFEDNQLQLPRNAVLAQKLIKTDKVDVLVTSLSNFGAVVSPIAEQNRVLHFSVATDPSVAAGKYNFMASSDVSGEAVLMSEELVKNGVKKIDAVVLNATGPQTMFDYFKKEVFAGQRFVIDNIYDVNGDEKDFRLLLSKIKDNKPDAMVVLLLMPAIDIFMKQYREGKIDIPVTGIETFTYMQNKALAEGMRYVDAASATDEFVEKFRQKTGKETTDYAEYMSFILQLITNGYEGAGTLDREKVAEYIQDNSSGLKTAVGVVKAEADGVINGQPVLKKIVNGKPTVVEEEGDD